MKVLNSNQSYTFSKIFELKIPSDELADEFHYILVKILVKKKLVSPRYSGGLDRLEELRSRLEEVLPYVDLSNETARREILMSKIATELVHFLVQAWRCDAQADPSS